jgi:hypothetical protein
MTSISDLSDSILVGQTLSTPLLSNLPEHEGDECEADYYDDEIEEEGCMPCFLKIVVSNEESDEVYGDDGSQPSWWNDDGVPWVALHALRLLQLFPALLFLQFKFGAGFLSSTEATVTMGLCCSVLSYVIVMFVVIATLYRRAIKDYKLACTAVLLAPDIFINIILGLVILDHLVAAFLFVLGSVLFCTIITAAISIRGLIATIRSAEEDFCKPLQDKLAPEILIIIIWGLVILDQLAAALLGSILCLAALGLIDTSNSAEEEDCKQLQDKLDVSLFKKRGSIRTRVC